MKIRLMKAFIVCFICVMLPVTFGNVTDFPKWFDNWIIFSGGMLYAKFLKSKYYNEFKPVGD